MIRKNKSKTLILEAKVEDRGQRANKGQETKPVASRQTKDVFEL